MKKMAPFGVAAALVVILTACPVIDTAEYGSLIMGFSSADMQTRTIVPSISMDVSYYDAHGEGPNGATFDQTGLQPGSSIVESSLETGEWTITADAYNVSAQNIGTGSVVVGIQAGQTETADVIVTPLDGPGTLSVVVDWPSSTETESDLTVTLTDAGGMTYTATSSTPITEAGGTETATYTWDAIAAGYYWLNIQLWDGAVIKWGANPSVRIVEGQTTNAAFTLDGTDLDSGMTVQIVPEMRNPVSITLTDNSTTPAAELVSPVSIVEGGSIDVSVTDPATAEYYQWYVDGASVHEGTTAAHSTLQYGSTLTPGLYRVDVGITTESDLVLSSKTFNIEVTAP